MSGSKPAAIDTSSCLDKDTLDPVLTCLLRDARPEDQVILGIEQELCSSGFTANGAWIASPHASHRLLERLKVNLPWLTDMRAEHCSAYFSWGGRNYIDCGHLETTSGEASTPEALLAQVFAMDRSVADAIRKEQEADGSRLTVTKSTVCYRNGTTFGNHLNVFVRGGGDFVNKSESAHRALLPFFASRLILGPGGFPNVPDVGFGFLLDPRACHIRGDVGSDSTSSRTIIHTRGRSEPLSSQGSRLHDIALSPALSPMATYLRFASTALVVHLIDTGHRLRRQLAFSIPGHEAMRKWNTDSTLKSRVASTVGLVGILDVQRRYHDFVAEHLQDAPAFAETALTHWCSLLDRLDTFRQRPAADTSIPDPTLADHLDWVRKRVIYDRLLETRGGTDWSYEKVGNILRSIPEELRLPKRSTRFTEENPPGDISDAPFVRLRQRRRMVALGLEAPGPDNEASESQNDPSKISEQTDKDPPSSLTDDQHKALQLRDQLQALDTQFSDLSNPGFGQIRWQLPELGIGDQQIAATLDGRLAAATANRSRLRSDFVRKWGSTSSGRANRAVDWCQVRDLRKRRIIDLSKPFDHRLPKGASDKLWSKLPEPAESRQANPAFAATLHAQRSVSEALTLYDKGRLIEADQIMTQAASQLEQSNASVANQDCLLRYWSWITVRRGYLDKAQQLIVRRYGENRQDEDVTRSRELLAWITIYRHAGLSNSPERSEFARWIAVGSRMLEARQRHSDHDGAAFSIALGLWQAFHSDRELGLRTVQDTLQSGGLETLQPFPLQRAYQTAARVLILNDCHEEAGSAIARAHDICQNSGFKGELSLTQLLRSQCNYSELRTASSGTPSGVGSIREDLLEAREPVSGQRRWNPVSLARIDAALARTSGPDDPSNAQRRERITGLINSYDGLRDPLSELILREWQAWTAGEPAPERNDQATLGAALRDPIWWSL